MEESEEDFYVEESEESEEDFDVTESEEDDKKSSGSEEEKEMGKSQTKGAKMPRKILRVRRDKQELSTS